MDQKLESELHELKENLILRNELISELRSKEVDYKKKYCKLEEVILHWETLNINDMMKEYEAVRRDNNYIRASISIRQSTHLQPLSNEIGSLLIANERASLFQYSPRKGALDQLIEVDEDGILAFFVKLFSNRVKEKPDNSEEEQVEVVDKNAKESPTEVAYSK